MNIRMFPNPRAVIIEVCRSGFFKALDSINLMARGALSQEGYATKYFKSLKKISDEHITYLEEDLLPTINTTILNRTIKWSDIRLIEFNGVENNLPHTIGSIIFIPVEFWKCNRNLQKRIIRHELVHIFQRKFPDDTNRFIEENFGYRYYAPRESYSTIRINPDTFHAGLYQNIRTGEVFAPMFKSSRPTSVEDVHVTCIVPNTGKIIPLENEHPYEMMAYTLDH